MLLYSLFTALLASSTLALNFDWENIQLTEEETRNNPAIRFYNATESLPQKECRAIPGDEDWPSDETWAQFNETLGGVLLKPVPLASPCYSGPLYDSAKCQSLKRSWTSMSVHSNDPTSVLSQWASGDSCVPTSQPDSTCSQGGYPIYVVNAKTVRHIQMTVNFARNNNIRLVIKNSGHDFNGKNIGGHALSVWIHFLKGATFHPEYTTSDYSGRAVAFAAGAQAMDAYPIQSQYNTTIFIPGGSTVGIAGGYFQGGGHSSYSSTYGLAADRVIRIHAITADGKLVTADAETNEDLYWAFRGGGGGNYGIVTSIVIAAFPQTPLASGSISFSTVPTNGQPNTGLNLTTFWEGVKAYWEYCITICDEGGFGYNFVRHATSQNTAGLSFTTSISLPNHNTAEYRAFLRPLLDRLNELGIPIATPQVQRSLVDTPRDGEDQPIHTSAVGDVVGNTLIASRLFQRSNYDNPTSLSEMHFAIRSLVEEGGFDFHGQNYSPTLEAAGHPNNAVHPAFRTAIMHAQGYEPNASWTSTMPVTPIADQTARHDRLQSYLQKWRDITPGSGSYMNEGDAQDPAWKDTFYGTNYARLGTIKRKWDPEGAFWVISGVGSDSWEVRGSGGGRKGLYTQDGKLCRVGG